MRKSKGLLVVCLGIGSVLIGVAFGYFGMEEHRFEASVTQAEPQPAPENNLPLQPQVIKKMLPENKKEQVVTPSIDRERDEVLEEEMQYRFDDSAIASMADARVNGDDRAPPIGSSTPGELPTPEELESPELYLEYESRQERKIYQAYVKAADIKIEMLEKQIAMAKERGLPEEELQVGIEKVKRIREMKAQLLQDNPDLLSEAESL